MEDQAVDTVVESTEPVVVEQVVEQVDTTPTEPSVETTPIVDTPEIDTSQTPAQTVDPYDEAIKYIDNTRTNNELVKPNPLDDWLNTAYDYDRNQAGSHWVAGKINDVKTQMGFLEALINEQLYGEMDLQKYYFDQNLATARAYAKEKQSETAYGFYRAAQEKALAEGQLTGWYMPAEANYLLGQWTIAKENLKDPNIDEYERNRASNVARMAESWFAHNNITTRGIECLNKLYLEENIRHNKVNEELQRQANDIAMQQASAGAAGVALQLRELEFQYGQMELAYGADITGDGVIGHARDEWKDLGSFTDQYNWVDQNFDIAWTTLGKNAVEHILGDNYQKSYDNYLGRQGDSILSQSLEESGYLPDSGLSKTEWKLPNKGEYSSLKDKNLYKFVTTDDEGNSVTRTYYKDNLGVLHQFSDTEVALSDGSFIGDKVTGIFATSSLKDKDGKDVQVGVAKNVSSYDSSFTRNKDNYTSISKKTAKSIMEYEKSGYKIKHGYESTQGINAAIVMEWTGEGDGPKGNLIEVSNIQGKVQSISDDQVRKITFNYSVGDTMVMNVRDGASGMEMFTNNSHVIDQSIKVGNDSKGNEILMYTDHSGNSHYMVKEYTAYSSQSASGDAYKIISFEEASKYNKDLSKIANSRDDYINSNFVREDIEIKNAEARADELSGAKGDKEMQSSVKSKSSGGGGGSSGGTTTPTSSKSDKDKVAIDKTSVALQDAEYAQLLGLEESDDPEERLRKKGIVFDTNII